MNPGELFARSMHSLTAAMQAFKRATDYLVTFAIFAGTRQETASSSIEEDILREQAGSLIARQNIIAYYSGRPPIVHSSTSCLVNYHPAPIPSPASFPRMPSPLVEEEPQEEIVYRRVLDLRKSGELSKPEGE